MTTGIVAGVADGVRDTVLTGSLMLALPIALAAGLVSFLSPCVLPLVPGYLSYVTGMVGLDLDRPAPAARLRLLLGGTLFVLGFTVVFVSFGAFFGGLGALLREHQLLLTRILGALTVGLGLVFLAGGGVPGLRRDLRAHARPPVGLLGAPLLGVLFGLGWSPCIGPTLAAVQTLAFTEGSAGRGAVLSVAYCLGLGLPFLLAALAYRRVLGAFGWVRRHSGWVMRLGGGLLIAVGLLLLTGAWDVLTRRLQGWIAGFETVV
jgi:cytochrome c-type biogenesis protein